MRRIVHCSNCPFATSMGGTLGRPLALVIQDTGGDAQRAAVAVDELTRLGVVRDFAEIWRVAEKIVKETAKADITIGGRARARKRLTNTATLRTRACGQGARWGSSPRVRLDRGHRGCADGLLAHEA